MYSRQRHNTARRKKDITRVDRENVLSSPMRPRWPEGPPNRAPFCQHPRSSSLQTLISLPAADGRAVLWLGRISRARCVARNASQGNRNGRGTKVSPADLCIACWGTAFPVASSLPGNQVNRLARSSVEHWQLSSEAFANSIGFRAFGITFYVYWSSKGKSILPG